MIAVANIRFNISTAGRCIMKECPLQKIEAEFGSLGYRVMERTSFRAEIAPAEVQRHFRGALLRQQSANSTSHL
jgi:hypothetical protein